MIVRYSKLNSLNITVTAVGNPALFDSGNASLSGENWAFLLKTY